MTQMQYSCLLLQDAHVTMLRKDMAHLDLELLELKLKLRAGEIGCWPGVNEVPRSPLLAAACAACERNAADLT